MHLALPTGSTSLGEDAPVVTARRRFFRAMARDGSVPSIGDRDLGVRVPTDIEPDALSVVHPNTGGMSVFLDDPLAVPRPYRPRSLGGTGRKAVWEYAADNLPAALFLRGRGLRAHALVEPRAPQTLEMYLGILASTQPDWGLVGE
jgi:hypothetical protein